MRPEYHDSTGIIPAGRPHFSLLVLLCICLAASSFTSGCAPKQSVFNDSINLSGINGESVTKYAGRELSQKLKDSKIDPNSLTQKVLSTAFTQYGKAYCYGGSSPQTGFDCSGFTQWAFAQNGIQLPRTTRAMLDVGSPVEKESIRPGDLLIYRYGRSRTGMHVGIYTGNGKFIHSPQTGDRIKESLAFEGQRSSRLLAIRRVVDDSSAAPLPKAYKDTLVAQAKARNFKPAPAMTASSKSGKRSQRNQVQITKHYEIKKGDNIWLIARKLGVSPKNLMAANNLPKRHTLKIGQKLAIP